MSIYIYSIVHLTLFADSLIKAAGRFSCEFQIKTTISWTVPKSYKVSQEQKNIVEADYPTSGCARHMRQNKSVKLTQYKQ